MASSEGHEVFSEKDPKSQNDSPTEAIPKYDEKTGDVENLNQVRLTKDTILMHPQPTSDPLDPLNWSFLRKHSILAIVMAL
jgi:hypothetical protein